MPKLSHLFLIYAILCPLIFASFIFEGNLRRLADSPCAETLVRNSTSLPIRFQIFVMNAINYNYNMTTFLNALKKFPAYYTRALYAEI